MTLDQYIEKLQALRAQHGGNLPVYEDSYDADGCIAGESELQTYDEWVSTYGGKAPLTRKEYDVLDIVFKPAGPNEYGEDLPDRILL